MVRFGQKVSKYLPRKGTETFKDTGTTEKIGFQNIYPARGRKPVFGRCVYIECSFKIFTPQGDGNTDSEGSYSADFKVSKYLPRKGTETGGKDGRKKIEEGRKDEEIKNVGDKEQNKK